MPQSSQLPDVHIPQTPFHEYLIEKLEQHGSEVALIDSLVPSRRLTFDEVNQRAHSIATALHHRGLRRNDVVSVFLPNCIEYPVIYLGIWLRGGIGSSANSVYTAYELEHYFTDCQPKFVFTTDELAPTVIAANMKLKKKIQEIVVIKSNATKPLPPGTTDFDQFFQTPADPTLPRVKINVKEDVIWLPYSSGTTGKAKGVMITHYNVSSMIAVLNNKSFFLTASKGDNVLGFLPMFHIFGFAITFMGLIEGTHTVVIPKFEPNNFLKTIQDYKVRFFYAVPPILVFLAKDPTVSHYDISCLQAVFAGAAPIGRELSEELLKRHPNIKFLMQVYGMTEIGGSHCMMPVPKEKLRHGSCGVLVSNIQCMVVDIENGKELGANQRGELCVKGPTVMKGYLNRPDATASTIDEKGWLHTGDIGYFDDEGYYYIVDRLKELIKVKSFQVPPAELEDLLLSMSGVQDVAVIGVPDDEAGELPRAYVVLKPGQGSSVSAEDVQRYVHDRVAHFKRLKGGVEFVKQLPKSASGKILRRILKDQYLKSTTETNSKL